MTSTERSTVALQIFVQAMGVALGEFKLKCFTLKDWDENGRTKFNIKGEIHRNGQTIRFNSGFSFALDKNELYPLDKTGFFLAIDEDFFDWVWDSQTRTHRISSSAVHHDVWFVGKNGSDRWLEPEPWTRLTDYQI